MNYYWGKKAFLEEIKKIKDMIEKETNPEKLAFLRSSLNSTRNLYFQTFEDISAPKNKLYNSLYDAAMTYSTYPEYYSLVSKFSDSLLDYQDKFSSIETLLDLRTNGNGDFNKIGDCFISKERNVSLVKLFYENLDDELNSYFQEIYKDRYSSIRFLSSNYEGKILDSNDYGIDYYINATKKNFIAVRNTQNIGANVCLTHECGHAIHNLMNPEKNYWDTDYLLWELPSIFMELLNLEENVGNFDEKIINVYKYSTLCRYYDFADVFSEQVNFIKYWKKFKYKYDKDTISKINEFYPKEIIDDLFQSGFSDSITYPVSYILALELLHIYKQDKKEALKILKKLMTMPDMFDSYTYANSILEFNNNAKTECEDILNKTEEVLRK